jgi:hypothetical protein
MSKLGIVFPREVEEVEEIGVFEECCRVRV